MFGVYGVAHLGGLLGWLEERGGELVDSLGSQACRLVGSQARRLTGSQARKL